MIHLEILTLLWPSLTGRDKIFYHFSIHLYILSKFKPSDCSAHHVGPFSHVEARNPRSKVRFLIGDQIFFFVLAIHASGNKTFYHISFSLKVLRMAPKPYDKSPEWETLTGHSDEIRTCCIGNRESGHPLIATASDDSTVQLWDTRNMPSPRVVKLPVS